MNIFVLSRDPVKAAEMLCDTHVVAMGREAAQMLSTAAHMSGVEVGYKPTHHNHPCTVWARRSKANFEWLLAHGFAICMEYTRRYLHVHGAKTALIAVRDCAWLIRFKETELTPFAQAMPEQYKHPNAVTAYRAFYKGEKARIAKWRNGRSPPSWWP